MQLDRFLRSAVPSTSAPVWGGRPHPSPSAGRVRPFISVIARGFAEVLLTAGVILLLFVAWQLWWTNLAADRTQTSVVSETARRWSHQKATGPAITRPPVDGEVWGILHVPRFGQDYAKPIAEGIDMDVLNSVGIGRYPGTQRPDEVGNIGLAGHRQSHGQVFWDMDQLRAGDEVYLQTHEGVYTYAYRSTHIVHPSQAEVLFPVPGDSSAEPTRKMLTLTTCHPPFTTDMRMIVHLEQTGFSAANMNPPVEIREAVSRTTGREGG